MRYPIDNRFLVPFSIITTILLSVTLTTDVLTKEKKSPYVYENQKAVPRHFTLVTNNPEFNLTWSITIPEILSRQLLNGEFIESSVESNMYPHCFPRNVYPDILLRSGYFEEVRKYLDFMWKNQKKDGSFWNYFDRTGKGEGIVEEDGGAYIIWQTFLYYLHTRDQEFLGKHWDGVVRTITYLEGLRDRETGLFYSTAGYSEGKIKGGFNIYHQTITLLAMRNAARIAEVLGKTTEAQEYKTIATEIPGLIKRHLFSEEDGRFIFQRRRDGTVNDKPYPAFFILGYYDVFDPMDDALYRTVRYVREGPLYGEYSEEIFGFEGIDIERATGSGFWIGQAGHGWLIPYLLKRGDLKEASKWFRGLAATRDRETNLIPEHINWSGFDEDGGKWNGKSLDVLPSPTAWVDPGNLYSMGTAMRTVFFMVDSKMDGPTPSVTLRIPDCITTLSASNIQTPLGYIDILFDRHDHDTTIHVSGAGEGVLQVLLLEGENKPSVTRDGEPYDQFSYSEFPSAVDITTDFSHHTFLLSTE